MGVDIGKALGGISVGVNIGELYEDITGQTAAKEQIKGIERASAIEQQSFNKAADLLGKARDEIISEADLSSLKQQGLITDAEEKATATVNRILEEQKGILTTGLERVSTLEQDAFNKAAEALNKGKSDIISEAELSSLRQQGLLTEGEKESAKIFSDFLQRAEAAHVGGAAQAVEAIESGSQSAINALKSGTPIARGDLTKFTGEAIQTLQGGTQRTAQLGLGLQPYIEQPLTSQTQAAMQTLGVGLPQAQQQALDASRLGIEAQQPFLETGQQALGQLRGLLGIGSPEEIATAEASLQASPLLQFQLGQQEEAIQRAQKARGGLLSGAAMREELLAQTPLIQQERERQISNLANILSSGQAAASQIGELGLQTGLTSSDIARQQALQQAGIQTGLGQQLTGTRQALGSALLGLPTAEAKGVSALQASLAPQLAGLTTQQQTNIANLLSGASQQQAGIQEREGTTLSNILLGGGQQLGAQRLALSPQLAGIEATRTGATQQAIGGEAQNLANLRQQLGLQLGGIEQQRTQALSNLLGGAGAQLTAQQLGLGSQLSNLEAMRSQARQQALGGTATGLANLATGAGGAEALRATQLGQARAQESLALPQTLGALGSFGLQAAALASGNPALAAGSQALKSQTSQTNQMSPLFSQTYNQAYPLNIPMFGGV